MKRNSEINLSHVSSDEEHGFTMSLEDAANGLGILPQAVRLIAAEDELLAVSTDSTREEHITKAGVVKIGSQSPHHIAQEFAAACKEFSPSW